MWKKYAYLSSVDSSRSMGPFLSFFLLVSMGCAGLSLCWLKYLTTKFTHVKMGWTHGHKPITLISPFPFSVLLFSLLQYKLKHMDVSNNLWISSDWLKVYFSRTDFILTIANLIIIVCGHIFRELEVVFFPLVFC